MRRLLAATLGALLVAAPFVGATAATNSRALAPAGSLEVIGHEPLMNRGMNAALAIHGNYAYVGFRSDGTHPNAGVAVVDISKPTAPKMIDQITDAEGEGRIGETSRELRIWPEKNLLIVLNLAGNCTPYLHLCSATSATMDDNFRFYDISGKNAAAPKLISEYLPSLSPHEFFLWDDPKKKGRALMFISTPGGGKQLLVTDISGAAKGKFNELGTWSALIPEAGDNRLHSLSISNDGNRGYVAYLEGGSFVIDTSQFAAGKKGATATLVTPIQNRVHWGDPGAHTAVKLWGKPYMLVTDEIYGEFFGVLNPALGNHGCPWGWTRMVDIKNPVRPKVVAEYKIEENHQEFCDSPVTNPPDRKNVSSYAAHNPTLTKNLAFITWHSGGLQAVSLTNPRKPTQIAELRPEPLTYVTTEDPVLSSGRDKVVMWSYPVIKKGIIWVVDLRNGLYAVKYKGPNAAEVSKVKFLEGNSNLGDALRLGKGK